MERLGRLSKCFAACAIALILGAIAVLALSPTPARAEAGATENVYAILYDSGHLVLQDGDTPDPAEGEVVATYTNFLNSNHPGWLERAAEIKKVTVKDRIKPSTVGSGVNNYLQLRSYDGWFNGCLNLEEAYLNKLDMSEVTDVSCMFSNCYSLRKCEIDKWDVSRVRNAMLFFAYCFNLEYLKLPTFNLRYAAFYNLSNDIDLSIVMCNIKDLDLTNMGQPNFSNYQVHISFFGTNNLFERITLGNTRLFWGRDETREGTRIPSGYTWESEQDGTLYTSDELMTAHTNDPAGMAGSYHIYHVKGEYFARDLGLENMWRMDNPNQLFKGYCMNLKREGVYGYYDRIEITDDLVLKEQFLDDESKGSVHGYEPLGSNMREALMTLIYFGYNGTDTGREIQEKYGLTDEEYMDVTQEAIWDFTDRYNAKRGPSNFTGSKLAAYNELTNKHFPEIPGEYKLYLYHANDAGRQNLLSIDGVETDVAHGGIRIHKFVVESSTYDSALAGAEFAIYRCESEEDALAGNFGRMVTTLISDENGEASTGIRDLEEGWYAVEEIAAPRGYFVGEPGYDRLWYAVHITRDATMYEVGYQLRNGRSQGLNFLHFFNTEDTSVTGGGLVIAKTNADGSRGLGGAEFEVVDASGEVIATLSTDAETGEARTPGNKDLPLGTYTIRESKAPDGYKLSDETREVTISENKTYLVLTEPFMDESKVGSVEIEAEKKLTGSVLTDGQFEFELYDAEGSLLETVACGADGVAKFSKISYDADDLGYKNYYIREVVPDNAVNADGVSYADADDTTRADTETWTLDNYTYDGHEEWITVTIYDDDLPELVCEIVTDKDGIVFTNSFHAEGKAQITAKKVLEGAKLQDSQFTFELRDESGKVVGTASNAADGSIAFDPIAFTQDDLVVSGEQLTERTLTFTVSEVNDGKAGIVYDDSVASVGVRITFSDSGELSCEVVSTEPTFTNRFEEKKREDEKKEEREQKQGQEREQDKKTSESKDSSSAKTRVRRTAVPSTGDTTYTGTTACLLIGLLALASAWFRRCAQLPSN